MCQPKTFLNISVSYYLAEEIIIANGHDGRIFLKNTEVMKVEMKNKHLITTIKNCLPLVYPIDVFSAKAAYLSKSNTNIICGGLNDGTKTSTRKCFQLNAASVSWDEVNSMNIGRYDHAITSIGQTLVTCGGATTSLQILSSCEKWTSGQWTSIQPLPIELVAHCMLTIDNTTILVLGGYSKSRVRINQYFKKLNKKKYFNTSIFKF